MPRIQPIQQEVSPYGDINGRRATAGDFGAGIGAGLDAVGDAGQKASTMLQEQADRANVTDIQAKMAQARAEWTVSLQNRAQKAPLGDTTLAPKFDEDLQAYLSDARGKLATTKVGAQHFDKLAADMRAHLFQSAGLYQAESVGKKAVADYSLLVDANARTVVADPTQAGILIQQTEAAINDPNGAYKNVPADKRDALAKSAKALIAYNAIRGEILTLDAPELALKQLKEGKGIVESLDAKQYDDLVKSAQTAVYAKETRSERLRLDQERALKDAQKEVSDKFLGRIIDPKTNGALSDKDILADQTLDASQKQHFIDYKLRRAREAAAQHEARTNPAETRRLMLDIHAADDDPRKTYNMEGIMESYRAGKISTAEMKGLRTEVDQLRDGGTRGFQQDVQSKRRLVERTIGQAPQYTMQPALVLDITNRFNNDLDSKIAEYRAANKDPRVLLNAENKESPLHPANFATYLTPPKQAIADEAGKVVAGGRVTPTAKLPTHNDYDKLKKGDQYTDPQGRTRTKS